MQVLEPHAFTYLTSRKRIYVQDYTYHWLHSRRLGGQLRREKVVLVGDTDFSKTIENEIEIGDDHFTNLTTGSIISGDMKDIYRQLCDVTEKISDNKYLVPTPVIANIYETFLEECEDGDSFIMHHEYNSSQFTNNIKKYNTAFYFRYLVEDEDNIESESIIISKSRMA